MPDDASDTLAISTSAPPALPAALPASSPAPGSPALCPKASAPCPELRAMGIGRLAERGVAAAGAAAAAGGGGGGEAASATGSAAHAAASPAGRARPG